MATLDQLSAALVKADAAGNTADAKALADAIRQMRAPAAPETSIMQDVAQGVGNLAAGALRGAGSIGATLLYPIDKATDLIQGDRGPTMEGLIAGKQPLSRNEERRQAMDDGLQQLGAEPDSMLYKGGKLAGEIAGTAGAGGVAGNALARIPGLANAAPGFINAVRTSGMSAGAGVPAANALTRVAGGAVSGGLQAGLVNPDDAGTGALIGGALPAVAQGAGTVARAVGHGVRGAPMAPEVKALADRAKELGIDIPADRLVNSKTLNAVAASLDYVPLSGRTATMNKMEDQLNTAVSRTFGQDSSNVTQALRKASGDLGAKFDSVLKSNTVKVDPQFMTDLAEASNQASRELGSDGAAIIGKQVDDIVAKAAAGEIDGQAAYNIKKTLDRIGNRNSPEAFYARELKKSLMSALDRSLGPEEAAAFAQTRKQYGNMLALENLAQNGADGGISIARLANMKNINNGDLQELADISAQFLKSREGAHGAAQRTVLGTGALVTGSATGTLPAVLGGMAVGRAANAGLNSNALKALVAGDAPQIGNALTRVAPLVYRSAPALSAQ